jgi:hypothetical protein
MRSNKLFFCLIISLSILLIYPFKIEAEPQNIEKDFSVQKSPLSNKFFVRYEGLSVSGTAFDVLSLLDEAYYDIGNDLGYLPEEPIEVIIYTSEKYELPSAMPDWATGIYDGRIHLKIGDIRKGRKHLKYIVYHEYTHALLRQWIKQDIPTWLNEGLAAYEGLLHNKYVWKKPVKCKFYSLTELNEAFYKPKSKESVLCRYKLSKETVSYLVKRYGKYRLKDLLEKLSEGANLDSAFSSVYYINLVQFEKDWKEYLKGIY